MEEREENCKKKNPEIKIKLKLKFIFIFYFLVCVKNVQAGKSVVSQILAYTGGRWVYRYYLPGKEFGNIIKHKIYAF